MSFEKLLVPLDGSRLAEEALVPAASLARHLGSEIMLLHVLERDAPLSVHGDRHITEADEGAGYLEDVAARLRAEGLEVRTHLHSRGVDSVAVAIDAHAHEYGTDLIVMCKHGRSGLRDRIMGNIAQQILRGGGTPILLRTQQGPPPRRFELARILVPLDFEHDVDAVLGVVCELAVAYGSAVTLLTAVPTLAEARRESISARLLPRTTAAGLEMEREEAGGELRRHGEQLARRGVDVEVALADGEPAAAILDEARARRADLVVLSTHARAGFETWLEHSVGGRVIAGGPENLLLLREL